MIFSKITQLCGEPQERVFVVRSSKGHHSKGFYPYFHVFKLIITPEVSALIRHTSSMVINHIFNLFSPIFLYSELLRKYCIKTFPITLKSFFSKTSEKVGFLEKKVCPNPRHLTLCDAVDILDKNPRFWKKEKSPFKQLQNLNLVPLPFSGIA